MTPEYCNEGQGSTLDPGILWGGLVRVVCAQALKGTDRIRKPNCATVRRQPQLVCLNPRLREDRARKREELLAATEGVLAEIAASGKRRKPGARNRERTRAAVGEQANRGRCESTSSSTSATTR